MPSLSIIIPTAGRPTLARALASVRGQLLPGDEVIVAYDTHAHDPARIRARAPIRTVAHDAGHHCFGHCQINAALKDARGDYIMVNDDDDAYTPGALDAVRAVLATLSAPMPLLFRFRAHNGVLYWVQSGWVSEGAVGGHCLIAPNIPGRLGQWGERYEGDFDAIADTVRHYDAIGWHTAVIAYARPPLGWRDVRTLADVEVLRRLRNSGRAWMTGKTAHISRAQQRRWWQGRDSDLRAYVFTDATGADIGAGVLSCRAGRWWITVMVAPAARRKGYGTLIYRTLTDAAPGPIYAEILADNTPSIRAAVAAGYQVVVIGDRTVTLCV